MTDNNEINFCVKCGNELNEVTAAENICPNCKKENPSGNNFCVFCGSALNDQAKQSDDKPAADIPTKSTTAKKNKAISKISSVFKVITIVIAVTAALLCIFYFAKKYLDSNPLPAKNIETKDVTYNIKGKYLISADNTIYYLNGENKLCTAESEKGEQTISGMPVTNIVCTDEYIIYTTEDGLFAMSTDSGKIVKTDEYQFVSLALDINENSESTVVAADKDGTIYSLSKDLSVIKKLCDKFTEPLNLPELFSGKYVYIYYNDSIYKLSGAIQQHTKDLENGIKISYLTESTDNSSYYYISDGLWVTNSDMQNDQKIIDSKNITEMCSGNGHIVFNDNGICVIDTQNNDLWRLSDKPVHGLSIYGQKIYFTSDDGYIYTVPLNGGKAEPLTYYMTETVNYTKDK